MTFFTVVTLVTATAALILVTILSSRVHARWDVTSTGSQRLAERTAKLLDHMEKRYEAVVATDFGTIDRRSQQRLVDVLDEFRRSNDRFDYTLLDTSTQAGLKSYKELLRRLVAREGEVIQQQVATIQLHLGGVTSLAAYLSDTMSPRLLEIQGQISAGTEADRANREYFTQAAATSRLGAKDLTAAAAKAAESLTFKIEDTEVPLTDQAASSLCAALAPAVEQLSTLAKEVKRFAEAPAQAGPAADSAKQLPAEIIRRRDQAAVVLDSLRKLKRPDILRVVETLRAGSAAIIIGPPEEGLCAVDLPTLLPSGAWLDAVGAAKADQSRKIEDMIATSIATLRSPLRPIVVVVHGEPREFFAEVPIVGLLKQRLEFRGIDLVEWAVVVKPEPPRLGVIDPERKRPVVYACMAPDSSQAGAQRGQLSGVQRVEKVAAAMQKLAAEGKNLLVSLNPSIVPTYGEADPFDKVLARFSLAAESGRPILMESLSAGNRTVETDQVLQADEDAKHVLASAVRALPTYLAWPIALTERPVADDPARVSVAGLYFVPAGANVWLESQWLRLWQTPRDQRGVLAEPPRFDEGRDLRWPSGTGGNGVQRWMVAAACERSQVGQPTQRLVVVGSNSWFIDQVTGRQALADSRRVPANPGNLELFENAVYWLAGQDDLIAQSPAAKAAPIITPIGDIQATRLRLAIILGLPLLSLLTGLLFRIIRG